MSKIMPVMAMLLLIGLANFSTEAQNNEKKEAEKPQTSTVDAWRNALPVNEQPSNPSNVQSNVEEVVESAAEIEKKILDLEKRMMEALKGRDSETLKKLLANDFLLAGINIPGAKSDKIRYIDWAVKNLELKTYVFDKPTVRVYPAAVVVTYNYKRQANIGGAPSDGDFVVTDVWIKRTEGWLAVSHHISAAPKP